MIFAPLSILLMFRSAALRLLSDYYIIEEKLFALKKSFFHESTRSSQAGNFKKRRYLMCDSLVIIKSGIEDETIVSMLEVESLCYSCEIAEIDELLGYYFSGNRATGRGVTKEMVRRMTPYQKFGILEGIFYKDIRRDTDEGFRKRLGRFIAGNEAEDFISAGDAINGLITVICRCGQEFKVFSENERLKSHVNDEGGYCEWSYHPGVCRLAYDEE